MRSVPTICGVAFVVIAPLIAAAWLPPQFPLLLRQLLLFAWGVGAIAVAERLLFAGALRDAFRALGFTRARWSAVGVSALVSIPMWAFLPLIAWRSGAPVQLRPDWLSLLVGVVLVNGITEEAIHRGFVFGHFRNGRSFMAAATLSAVIFAAQHVYIMLTTGWMIGLASVLLAFLLSYPLAFAFERGGNSIVAPAILHTSSNAPVMILSLPDELMSRVLLPHMAVVLISLYLVFASRRS